MTAFIAQSTVALDNAQVTEAENLLTALTGGTVPANATGTGLNALNQAKLNLQTAQNNLAYTNLYSPISGTVLTVSNAVGDTINAGNTFVTIADMSQSELTIYMDPLDYSNIKVGYNTNVVFDALPNLTYHRQGDPNLPATGYRPGHSVVQGTWCWMPNRPPGAGPDPAAGRDRLGGYHCGPGQQCHPGAGAGAARAFPQ